MEGTLIVVSTLQWIKSHSGIDLFLIRLLHLGRFFAQGYQAGYKDAMLKYHIPVNMLPTPDLPMEENGQVK